MSEAVVSLRGVTKTFETAGVTALQSIDLDVGRGEFVSLIGPSGCGKSTLLRVVGDLVEPTSGTVVVNGKSARQARIDREYGIVFQDPVLYDWRTVEKNIASDRTVVSYSLRARASGGDNGHRRAQRSFTFDAALLSERSNSATVRHQRSAKYRCCGSRAVTAPRRRSAVARWKAASPRPRSLRATYQASVWSMAAPRRSRQSHPAGGADSAVAIATRTASGGRVSRRSTGARPKRR